MTSCRTERNYRVTESSRMLRSRQRVKGCSREVRPSFYVLNGAQSIAPLRVVSGRESNSVATATLEPVPLELALIEVPLGSLSDSNPVAANCFDREGELRYRRQPKTRLEAQPLVAAATEPEKRGTILRPESYQGPSAQSNPIILRLRDQARTAAFHRFVNAASTMLSRQNDLRRKHFAHKYFLF